MTEAQHDSIQVRQVADTGCVVEPPRKRRRRPRSNQRCRRESCTRKRNGEYCSSLCAATDKELQTIQALIGQAGAGKVSTHLWVSAVQLNDTLTEAYRLKSVLTNIAERQALTDQALVGDSSSLGDQSLTKAQTSDQALDEESNLGNKPNLAPIDQT